MSSRPSCNRSSALLSILFGWLFLAGLVSPLLHGSIPRDRHPTVELPALIEGPPAAERVASAFPPARLELGLSEGDAAILRRVLVRQNPWSAFDPEGLQSEHERKWGATASDDNVNIGMRFVAMGMAAAESLNPFRSDSSIRQGGRDMQKGFAESREILKRDAPPGIREVTQYMMGVGSAGTVMMSGPAGAGELGDSVQQHGVIETGKHMVTGLVEHAVNNPVEFAGELTVGGAAGKALNPGGNSAKITRYMSEAEAKLATKSGEIPNVGVDGKPRPTHVTTDAPVDSALEAAKKYEITPPTHRATVPANRVPDLGPAPDGRPTTSGGGSQAATSQPIPVKPSEIRKLKQ